MLALGNNCVAISSRRSASASRSFEMLRSSVELNDRMSSKNWRMSSQAF